MTERTDGTGRRGQKQTASIDYPIEVPLQLSGARVVFAVHAAGSLALVAKNESCSLTPIAHGIVGGDPRSQCGR